MVRLTPVFVFVWIIFSLGSQFCQCCRECGLLPFRLPFGDHPLVQILLIVLPGLLCLFMGVVVALYELNSVWRHHQVASSRCSTPESSQSVQTLHEVLPAVPCEPLPCTSFAGPRLPHRECGPLPFRLPDRVLSGMHWTLTLVHSGYRVVMHASRLLLVAKHQPPDLGIDRASACGPPSSTLTGCSKDSTSDSVYVECASSHKKPLHRLCPRVGSPGRILVVCVFSLFFRYGEASNPGPPEPIRLGTFNGGGILHKGELLAQIPTGLWGVTETHLTHLGVQKLRDDLKFRKCTARLIPGAPAPPLSQTRGCLGGKCTGVAAFSAYPVRALPSQFATKHWDSGRIQVATAHVGDAWIKVGVAYGFSANNKNVETMQNTDDLLAELTERIVFQAHGPRAIVGDFNCHSNLPQFDIWREYGFIEVQQLALAKWKIPVKPTYRNVTVIDQVWLSADLAAQVSDVRVDTSYFADHACLYATLDRAPKFEPFDVWRQPLPIPWDDIGKLPNLLPHELPEAKNPDFLPQLFATLEQLADSKSRQTRQVGLLAQQKGRCHTLTAKRKNEPTAPLKRSRPGDVQIQFMGETFFHVQWCRQLRRLQSFARLRKSTKADAHLAHETRALWQAIRRAPGFAKGFPHMWANRSSTRPGAPAKLPKEPPSPGIAQIISEVFRQDFQQLESALIRARGHAARQARKADANKAFRDVARPRALPVQTLAMSKVAHVTEVETAQHKVHYHPAVFDCDEPLSGPTGILIPAAHVPGQLTFEMEPSLAVGDALTQPNFHGSRQDVASKFLALWNPMWNRHKDMPLDRWDEAIRDIAQVLPRPDHDMQLPPITDQQWLKAVKAKRSKSATGPDGVARKDLLAMPAPLVTRLVEHLHLIEQGTLTWHPCSMTGLIALVEKKPGASHPSEFRPICVLSFIYRTWASIRAKQCLQWLDTLSCATQCGNRPGTSARHLWWKIAQQIEGQHLASSSMSGIITDVVKCFNTLPRQLVAFCGRALGLPLPLIQSWHHAIHGVERRFVIEGAASAPLRSETGCPEGDSMSVVAMSILNIAMHSKLQQQVPEAVVYSYVDNWEALAHDPAAIPAVARSFAEFATQTDIRLDVAKTDTWSLSAEGRKQLKGEGFKVVLAGRDFGGQMIYSKKPSIAVIRNRLQAHATFWNWLSRSQAPTGLKLRLLHTVAWPRCLYGISNHTLGDQHFQQLRIAAMQSLGWQKKGANSRLQFGLDRDMRGDPGYFCLATTVNDFRDLHDADLAYPVLDEIAKHPHLPHAPGPCKALYERLRTVGWYWRSNGYIQDHDGIEWHLVDSPIQWVNVRLRQAWSRHVGSQVSSRHTFGGLQNVDIQLCHENLHQFSAAEQGFLRVVQNGSFFTKELLFQTGKVPDKQCPFCTAVDSLAHRLWDCPHFAPIRNSLDQDALMSLRNEPTCFLLRGWVVEHSCQVAFRRALFDIPDEIGHIQWPPHFAPDEIHFFTDGSCSHPSCPGLRLGTWGVCVADLSNDTFLPIAGGGIPDGYHTTLRAEMCAAISAFVAGLQQGKPFTIWVDNQTVHMRLQSFLTDGVAFCRPKQANHDLWNRLAVLANKALSKGIFRNAIKVRSHEDSTAYPELVERWAIRGNMHADAAADSAREGLPPHVLTTWHASCQRVSKARRMRDAMRTLITKSGFLATADQPKLDAAVDAAWQRQIDQPRRFDPADLSLLPLPPIDALPAKHSLGPHAALIHAWIPTLAEGTNVRPIWLSSHQLYIHFQGKTRLKGFCFNQKTNKWDSLEHEDPVHYDFHKGANSFQAAVKCLITGIGGTWKPQKRIPEGSAYKCWVNCVLVTASVDTFQRIDDLMRLRGATGMTHVTKSMRSWDDFCGCLCP